MFWFAILRQIIKECRKDLFNSLSVHIVVMVTNLGSNLAA